MSGLSDPYDEVERILTEAGIETVTDTNQSR
ncbi:MAG: hypothetical protein J07HQX50_00573 [Haloquadratum sp. J07HQX50]|nr:MAG: hypothetical protein J07HQX50_00573 [Haloquadratum sp. J07HQX50]